MKRLAILALTALASSCDRSSGPVPVAEVEILLDSASVDERMLEVGETVQLTASIRDGSGQPLTGRQVTWASSLPEVARVSESGLVTAVGPGETLVSATAEGVRDEVVIVVQAPPADLVCADGDPGISLSVGEAYTTSGGDEPVTCIAGGSGSEYVMVPFNAASAANLLNVEVAASGVVTAIGPPNPALLSRAAEAGGASVPRLVEDTQFHTELRARERREVGPLAGGQGGMAPMFSQAPLYATVPSTGDTLRFNVNSEDACSNADYRGAVVRAISTRAVVVADTSNPSGGFTDAEYKHFAETFDTLVYPKITENFGTPSDIDDNGARSVILFTKAVNELTEPNSSSYVGGFFFSRDLFPKKATATMGACATSNEAELLYMLVPDPNGEVNNNKRSKEFVAERTVGVLAHEFQHLINASRRLFEVGGENWLEETWLNEGLSHIAEELTFYAASSLQPRQNIGMEELRANEATFDRFVEYQWSNLARYIEYLKKPAEQSPMGVDSRDQDLATRGAIWAFLRYAADRRGGPEAALWRSMTDTDRTGLSNLNSALNNEALAWMRDWATSVYSDDAVPTAAVYQQPSWDFREIITSVRSGGSVLYPTYPLRVVQLGNGTSNQQEMELQGGGANFLRFGVASGDRAAIRATSGGLTPPSRLRVTIVRTK